MKNKHPKLKMARKMIGNRANTESPFFSKQWFDRKDAIEDRVERQIEATKRRKAKRVATPVISR